MVCSVGGMICCPGAKPGRGKLAKLCAALGDRGGNVSVREIGDYGSFVHVATGPDAAVAGVWQDEDIYVTWDGRLDNTDELDRALGSSSEHDLQRVALSYKRWGIDGFNRLLGDYALSLWDIGRRRLLLARDPMGVRPLFYTFENGVVTWGTTLEAVLAGSDAGDEIDEDWIAGYLAHAIDTSATPYRCMRAVPPGHAVVLEGGALADHIFYELKALPIVRLPDDRAYEERFAELFCEAVRCRLAGHSHVGAELSGGMDSSSIVCVADWLIRDGQAPTGELFTLSLVYERSPESDERPFIRSVEAHTGRPGVHIAETDAPPFTRIEEILYHSPTERQCVNAQFRRMSAAMQARGARLLLSGLAGDHVVNSDVEASLLLADQLASGQLRSFANAVKRWHEAQHDTYPALIAGAFLHVLTPGRRRRLVVRHSSELLNAVEPSFARRTGLAERFAARAGSNRERPPSKRAHVAAIRGAVQMVGWLYDYDAGPWRYQVAYPFLDRRLAEFCLSVPSEVLNRPGDTRSLHRRALRSWLPAEIATRRDKRSSSPALARELAAGWDRIEPLLRDPHVVRRGILRAPALHSALDVVRSGRLTTLPLLLKALALETWLRAHEGRYQHRSRTE
jgi:asparagine synthase (glutamine-hydrolysing)